MTNFDLKHTTKKGAYMSDREQSSKHTAKTPSPRTGIFATLRALLRVQGTNAPSHRTLSVAVGCAAVAIGILASAAPASATTMKVGTISEVSYTSAHVTGEIKPTGTESIYWSFEYSTNGIDWSPPNTANAIHPADGLAIVEADLAGLAGTTKYLVRLFATNFVDPDVVSPEPNPEFTTLLVDPPLALTIEDASEVTYTTAEVKGKIERPANPASPPFDPNSAFNTNCEFEYITDAQFEENVNVNSLPGFEGATPASCDPPNPVESPGEAPATAKLAGLAPATTYHLRLSASNAGGADHKEAASTFTTLSPVPTPTVITTDNASEVFYTTAEATGKVKRPGGPGAADVALDASCQFEYITDAQFQANVTNIGPGAGFEGATPAACEQGPFTVPDEEATVSAKLSSLAPATVYHLRLSAFDTGGADSKAAAATFATEAVANPTIVLDPITIHTDTTATFSGTIDTNAPAVLTPAAEAAFETHWQMSCNPACPNLSPDVSPATSGTVSAAEGSMAFSVDATELEPNTTYEVTLEATNAGGASTEVVSFATTEVVPTIKAAPGASDRNAGYTLQGVVNPHNSTLTACKFVYGPNSEADPAKYPFAVPCSPLPGEVNKAVTVEGHVSGLTAGATYHSRLVVSNAAGTEVTDDQIFEPTFEATEPCPNEALRKENSSLALPECRAYEMVSPPNKAGYPAELIDYTEDGSSVAYYSRAGNIANSGTGLSGGSEYVTNRTGTGWETIANLNGPLGSLFAGPESFGSIFDFSSRIYSADLRSSLWFAHRKGQLGSGWFPYLRNSAGDFALIGNTLSEGGAYGDPEQFVGTSSDLSHVVFNGREGAYIAFGPGVYEFVGTGNDQPRRIDVDNSSSVVSACTLPPFGSSNAKGNAVSSDGRVIVFTVAGGCGAPNPPANEIWARVGDTTSYAISASQCSPACASPEAPAVFQGAAKDGSRVYFTTTAQLLNFDTDQTNDLYACDIPPGTPAPIGTANPCSSLHQVSGPAPGAEVENVASVSADGSTVYFTAQGVLAHNEDALGEEAAAGDHNLYAWRTDAAHPAGQTIFLARLDSNDLGRTAQATSDGHYLVFTTASQLVATDTDNSRDVYRYDADSERMTRVSTNVFGVAGNADDLDARIQPDFTQAGGHPTNHHPHPAVSNDGEAIVFTTSEGLSPLDGNDQPDVYLWKDGHVSLISTGAVGSESEGSIGGAGVIATIDGSGENIYFNTVHQLTPGDGDDVGDIYDARVEGGISAAQAPPCSGEACQPPVPTPLATPPSPANRPNGEGNVKPCPKNKVAKGNKCIKKSHGKHHKKNGKGHSKKAGHNRGGSK